MKHSMFALLFTLSLSASADEWDPMEFLNQQFSSGSNYNMNSDPDFHNRQQRASDAAGQRYIDQSNMRLEMEQAITRSESRMQRGW